jgi:aminoglycoside phosphotransferase (APT) family kinase protein
VRLPRRAASAALIEHEQQWLGRLAPALPVAVPVPVFAGRPGAGYPWCWSVVPWFAGERWSLAGAPDRAVDQLAMALIALHRPAPIDAPANPWRGVPLAQRVERFAIDLAEVRRREPDLLTAAEVTDVERGWRAALSAPPWSADPVWIHGDLHPANLIVDAAGLVAVIDFGDLTAGDPATDLAVAWSALDAAGRDRFRRAYGGDDALWLRARGWALALGLAMIAGSPADDPIAAIGRRALDAARAEG